MARSPHKEHHTAKLGSIASLGLCLEQFPALVDRWFGVSPASSMALALSRVRSSRAASFRSTSTGPRARPAVPGPRSAPRAPRLVARSKVGGDDGWESWEDAPDTPALNGSAPSQAAAAGGGQELDWRTEVQGLARSLRSSEQVGAYGCVFYALQPLIPVRSTAAVHYCTFTLTCRQPAPNQQYWRIPPLSAGPLPAAQQSSDDDAISGSNSSSSDFWDPWGDRAVPERCFLVGVQLKQGKGRRGYGVQESLEELGRLADTAGLEVMGSTYQMLDVVSARVKNVEGVAGGFAGMIVGSHEEKGAAGWLNA